MELGRIGVWLGPLSLRSAAETRAFAPELEGLGYSAIWFGEGVGTKECFTQAATLLASTENAVVATGIANLYARDPMATANGARTLADAYPGRAPVVLYHTLELPAKVDPSRASARLVDGLFKLELPKVER